mgnify:CR=1 FL=1
MENINIKFAQYTVDMAGEKLNITATIDGVRMSVPLDPANRHYSEILRQVEAGTLVIQEADNV